MATKSTKSAPKSAKSTAAVKEVATHSELSIREIGAINGLDYVHAFGLMQHPDVKAAVKAVGERKAASQGRPTTLFSVPRTITITLWSEEAIEGMAQSNAEAEVAKAQEAVDKAQAKVEAAKAKATAPKVAPNVEQVVTPAAPAPANCDEEREPTAAELAELEKQYSL